MTEGGEEERERWVQGVGRGKMREVSPFNKPFGSPGANLASGQVQPCIPRDFSTPSWWGLGKQLLCPHNLLCCSVSIWSSNGYQLLILLKDSCEDQRSASWSEGRMERKLSLLPLWVFQSLPNSPINTHTEPQPSAYLCLSFIPAASPLQASPAPHLTCVSFPGAKAGILLLIGPQSGCWMAKQLNHSRNTTGNQRCIIRCSHWGKPGLPRADRVLCALSCIRDALSPDWTWDGCLFWAVWTIGKYRTHLVPQKSGVLIFGCTSNILRLPNVIPGTHLKLIESKSEG